ncbi:MAG: hypothetical protein ACRDOO_01065 [Actinomadura sp.]
MGAAEDLDAAVHAARAATHELLDSFLAHQMVPGILNLQLVPNWPAPVRAAYLDWEDQINDIARILVCKDGAQPGTQLSDRDRTALIIRACILGLDLADPPA